MIDPAPIIYLVLTIVFTLTLLRLRAIAIRKETKK